MSTSYPFDNLKNLGFEPDLIIDIGAFVGEWTLNCLNYYPNAQYLLFEPNFHEDLKKLKEFKNIKIINKILNSTCTEVDWYSRGSYGDTGDSFLKEKTKYYENIIPIKKETTTLKDEIEKNQIKGERVLIKLDTQGSELEILKGAGFILEKTDFIFIEIPFFGKYNENCPSFKDYINYLDSINFIPYEAIDVKYLGNPAFQAQADFMFINKNHNINEIVKQALMNF